MMVYLACPIDLAKDTIVNVQEAKNVAASRGISLFCPAESYRIAKHSTAVRERISTINSHALKACDGILAVLDETPTLGVPSEIEITLQTGKPVVIYASESLYARSVQLADWAMRGATVITDLDGLYEAMRKFSEVEQNKTRSNNLGVILVKSAPGSVSPERAYSDDAGYDLGCYKDILVPAKGSMDVPTGVSVAIPEGYWGLIIGRSSTWFKRGLLVVQGVIDRGWRGELFVAVYNTTNADVQVSKGDRLAQLVVLPAWPGTTMPTEELPWHERGLRGFGSTGMSGSIVKD